ncbi:hypothetical protein CSKR_113259 [Clonorchis sinensis]|uniref:Uncharacterized protein n=1 Tax=Clonorchis sinensis TaxID=79923 RepID=A0A3R7GL83_CLOSI|nr:hypothetical protein CSKR_113259 [Clonorchis sinensis]
MRVKCTGDTHTPVNCLRPPPTRTKLPRFTIRRTDPDKSKPSEKRLIRSFKWNASTITAKNTTQCLRHEPMLHSILTSPVQSGSNTSACGVHISRCVVRQDTVNRSYRKSLSPQLLRPAQCRKPSLPRVVVLTQERPKSTPTDSPTFDEAHNAPSVRRLFVDYRTPVKLMHEATTIQLENFTQEWESLDKQPLRCVSSMHTHKCASQCGSVNAGDPLKKCTSAMAKPNRLHYQASGKVPKFSKIFRLIRGTPTKLSLEHLRNCSFEHRVCVALRTTVKEPLHTPEHIHRLAPTESHSSESRSLNGLSPAYSISRLFRYILERNTVSFRYQRALPTSTVCYIPMQILLNTMDNNSHTSFPAIDQMITDPSSIVISDLGEILHPLVFSHHSNMMMMCAAAAISRVETVTSSMTAPNVLLKFTGIHQVLQNQCSTEHLNPVETITPPMTAPTCVHRFTGIRQVLQSQVSVVYIKSGFLMAPIITAKFLHHIQPIQKVSVILDDIRIVHKLPNSSQVLPRTLDAQRPVTFTVARYRTNLTGRLGNLCFDRWFEPQMHSTCKPLIPQPLFEMIVSTRSIRSGFSVKLILGHASVYKWSIDENLVVHSTNCPTQQIPACRSSEHGFERMTTVLERIGLLDSVHVWYQYVLPKTWSVAQARLKMVNNNVVECGCPHLKLMRTEDSFVEKDKGSDHRLLSVANCLNQFLCYTSSVNTEWDAALDVRRLKQKSWIIHCSYLQSSENESISNGSLTSDVLLTGPLAVAQPDKAFWIGWLKQCTMATVSGIIVKASTIGLTLCDVEPLSGVCLALALCGLICFGKLRH